MLLDSIYYNIGNFIYLGAQWIISVVLVRLGGFEDAGLFSLGLTISTMFGMIATYGMRSLQITDLKTRFSNYTYIVSRLITILAALIVCLLYVLIKRYDLTSLTIIILFMLYKCIEAYSDVLSAIWQKNNDMLNVGTSMGIRGVLNFFFFFAIYIPSKNLVFSVFGMFVSSFLSLVLFDFIKSKKYIKQSQSIKLYEKNKIIPLLSIGLLTMLFVFSTSFFNNIPKLIIESYCGVSLLGVFSSVFAPTVVISTFAVGVLLPVAPKMAISYQSHNKKGLLKIILACNSIFVLVGILAEIISLLIGRWIFNLIFGEEILKYFSLFYYVIIVSVLISIVNCYATLLIAIRKLKQLLTFSVSACVLVLILCLVLIPKYSIYGAAYAMIIASGIQFIAETVYILKIILSLKKTENEDEKTDSPCAVVTGCTGSVGVSLINKLVCEGYTVFAVLNPASARNSNIPENEKVKKIFCGIDEYQKLPEMINEKCSAFFHLAWAGTFGEGRNDVALQQKNIEYSLDAVKAAKALGCEVFVGVGSQAEYGRVNVKLTDSTPANPENEYGKAKLIASQRTKELCNELGIRHEWTRLLSVYGPFDHEKSLVYSAISQLKSGICPEYTPAEQIWDLLYCTDAANAIYLVAKEGKPNETYVIGSGEEKPLREYIETIHRVVNPDIKPVFGQRKYGENQVMYLCADIIKLENDTSYKQEIPFEEGIKRMAKEIK